ncbi:hypothetical protein EST38_g2053 [Candolleomyces aberdarensis]|uniref:Nucleotidyl transferase AbiEii/AbiGii toxin family protein n=1 Tax=Candolleomyces aberdarensis TaxID=2316362 RepID=A0A4Q2DTX0_9AGAR|nr:hypothetical protein EST38_g2053 [Candolleomyces aberdarensis]
MSRIRLAPRLLVPLNRFCAIATKHQKDFVLIGGAAVTMHALDYFRMTTDLDINVENVKWIPKAFKHAGGDVEWLYKPTTGGALAATLTYLHPVDAIRLDLAIPPRERLDLFVKHSVVTPCGIRYLDIPPLLAAKIESFGDRHERKTEKRASDYSDIEHLLSRMDQLKLKMPGDVKEMLLTPHVLSKFFNRVPEQDKETMVAFLHDLGICTGADIWRAL